MKKVNVVESVLKANDAVAGVNQKTMDAAGVLAVNLMSAPGSGKTSLLKRSSDSQTAASASAARRCPFPAFAYRIITFIVCSP